MEKSDLPIIFESDTSNLGKGPGYNKPSNKLARSVFRVIFLVLGLVILIEVILGLRSLSSPSQTIGKVQPMTGGKITLGTPPAIIKTGDSFQVGITINTGGHSLSGVDVVLKYNPQTLEVSPDSISKGGIFEEYPLVNADAKNGIIQISGVDVTPKIGFNGIGKFATINFRAKAASNNVPITVDYQPGITTDSNMIESSTSQDIIEEVINLTLKVL